MAEEGAVIRRGTLVLVALKGDYGKPRPALVVQADIGRELPSVMLCPVTSADNPEASQIRVTIQPSPHNGLRKVSNVMVDKLTSIPRSNIRASIGTVTDREIDAVTRRLAILLGIS